MRPLLLAAALLPFSLACGERSILEPSGLLGVAVPGAGGVRHVLSAEADTANGIGSFTIRSTLRNEGASAVSVLARRCFLGASDVRGGGPGLTVYEPLILCIDVEDVLTLAPGESETLTVNGVAPPGSDHDLRIRHLLLPQQWTEVRVRIP